MNGNTNASPFTPNFSPTLDAFIDFLREITGAKCDPVDRLYRISEELSQVVTNKILVPDMYLQCPPQIYGRNLILEDPKFVLMCFVWPAGITSPVHDHGTWGIMGVHRNQLRITNYSRLDDGNTPGHAELEEREVHVVTVGHVERLLPPHWDIHKVENPSDEKSVSLHVFGKEIRTAHRFFPNENRMERYSVDNTDMRRRPELEAP